MVEVVAERMGGRRHCAVPPRNKGR
jgi:hypothetical protein